MKDKTETIHECKIKDERILKSFEFKTEEYNLSKTKQKQERKNGQSLEQLQPAQLRHCVQQNNKDGKKDYPSWKKTIRQVVTEKK